MLNGGGRLCEYVVDRSGDGLLERPSIEEVEPGKQYYMQQVWKPNEFYPTVFDASVSWSTIEEIYKTGRIWRLKQ
jgi:hypothetical protein